jgi:hypothetical protein
MKDYKQKQYTIRETIYFEHIKHYKKYIKNVDRIRLKHILKYYITHIYTYKYKHTEIYAKLKYKKHIESHIRKHKTIYSTI